MVQIGDDKLRWKTTPFLTWFKKQCYTPNDVFLLYNLSRQRTHCNSNGSVGFLNLCKLYNKQKTM